MSMPAIIPANGTAARRATSRRRVLPDTNDVGRVSKRSVFIGAHSLLRDSRVTVKAAALSAAQQTSDSKVRTKLQYYKSGEGIFLSKFQEWSCKESNILN